MLKKRKHIEKVSKMLSFFLDIGTGFFYLEIESVPENENKKV